MKTIRPRTAAILLSILCGVVGYGQESQPGAAVRKAGVVPNVIRFGGSFRPSNGMQAQAVESVTLSVYRDQNGGTALWQETQNVSVDGEGKYSVLMGSTQNDGVPMDLLSTGEPRWLGAQFNRPGEIEQPRVLMASVPYALKSVDAETLGGKPASAYLLASPGTNTSSNLASNVVSTTAAGAIAPAASTTVMTNTAVKPRATNGTAGYIGVFTDATDIGNSVMQQSGGFIGVGTVPGAGAGTTPSLDLRTQPFSQIGMAQTTDYLTFFSSDTYGPAIYWNPGHDLRFGKGGTGLYNAFGFSEQMRIQSSTGNLGIGTATPGQKLDVNGNINMSGSLWYQGRPFLQMRGDVSSGNSALGVATLANGTAGQLNNTAVGYYALSENTGSLNTAVGMEALQGPEGGLQSGSYDTAVGYQALTSNASGSNNTAVGYQALQNNATGSNNTAVGNNALADNNGVNNTAFGYNALQGNTTGSNNVALGFTAGANVSPGNSGNIEIGNAGGPGDSNTIRIGNEAHTAFYAAAIYGVNLGGSPVSITSGGQLSSSSSSRRYKEDINDMGDASRGLMDLRPVTFHYKKAAEDGSKPLQYGLIAEEVAEVYPDLVVYNKDGQPDAVQYQMLPAMLLNEVQKQNAELRNQVRLQQEENRKLEERLAKLEASLAASPVPTPAAPAVPGNR